MVLMAALVMAVLWQVATRYLLHNPSSYTDELARYLMIWVALLGAALMTGRRGHLAIDILPGRLAPARRRYLDMFINSLIALFGLLVMVVGGSRLVFITLTLEQASPALQIPLGYIYLVIPFSGVLIVVYSLLNTIDTRRGDMLHQTEKAV
ncbi:TRAP transporter small permease [Exilibacterium tricleocarpae]|uniref:TRAP transporter small permease protein n=2 Tax=Exilibacterium tricleocarpae TaxID=2591008 RepID=A0A545UA68_9GAMM|nr:TRAP transporter small permease [Exilibacterium tricleocarpae]